MEVLQNDRTSKLPPSSTSSLRKSIIKISTNGRIDSEQLETSSLDSSGDRTRIIPIYRSISHNTENNDIIRLPSYTQQFNYKLPFNRINFTISSPDSFSRTHSRISQKSNDRCPSSSSGYDSNLNSSSSGNSNRDLLSSPEIRFRDIRRTCSSNRLCGKQHKSNNLYNSFEDSMANNKKLTTRQQKRYSLNENVMKEDFWKTLDQVEKRIVFFREIAFELFDEKNKLLDALNKINSASSLSTFTEVDLQDIRANTDHLLNRLNSIDIVIKPFRSSSQIEAFEKVNQYVDGLNRILANEGKIDAKKKCLSYISSCSSDDLTDANNNEMLGPMDESFQKMVIDCALEDQKIIKKRLKSFLEEIEKSKQ